MLRNDMISKLKSVRFLITDLTYTYDMGMQFTIITGDGATVNFGNYSDWPVSKCKITDEIRNLHSKIIKGEKIEIKDIRNAEFAQSLISQIEKDTDLEHDKNGSKIESLSSSIIKQLKSLSLNDECFYSFIATEQWNKTIKFFNDYESLEKFMIYMFANEVSSYESMDEEELEYYYNCAADENWHNTMPYYEQFDEEPTE